jgi:hypothetical protein
MLASSRDLNSQSHLTYTFFMLNELKREVIVGLLILGYCKQSLFKRPFHNIVALSFTIGSKQSTRRNPLTQCILPTNFVPLSCIEYTLSSEDIKVTWVPLIGFGFCVEFCMSSLPDAANVSRLIIFYWPFDFLWRLISYDRNQLYIQISIQSWSWTAIL